MERRSTSLAKTTSPAKTTISPKNHKLDKKPHHRAFAVFGSIVGAILAILHAVRYAHGTRIPFGSMPLRVAFSGLFPFLTRNALRAIQKPQAIHKTTKPHAKTTSDPQAQNREKQAISTVCENDPQKPQKPLPLVVTRTRTRICSYIYII